ncbi:16617_t:CDS:1, partial [Rhizophagus irregularis]
KFKSSISLVKCPFTEMALSKCLSAKYPFRENVYLGNCLLAKWYFSETSLAKFLQKNGFLVK